MGCKFSKNEYKIESNNVLTIYDYNNINEIFTDTSNKATKIVFDFNHHYENIKINKIKFPKNIQTIVLKTNYCHNICLNDRQFPTELHTLQIVATYNRELESPYDSRRLDGLFQEYFPRWNPLKFPDNLHTLKFNRNIENYIDNIKFPNKLHRLKIYGKIYNSTNIVFPDILHHLTLNIPSYLDLLGQIGILQIPNNLHKLTLCNCELRNGIQFPQNLHTLKIYDYDFIRPNLRFPDNLHTLKIHGRFGSISNVNIKFPDSLHTLILDIYIIDEHIKLPNNLHTLHIKCFKKYYDASADKINLNHMTFPDSIHELDFGSYYGNISSLILPANLQKINLKHFTKQHITGLFIPYNTKNIVVSRDCAGVLKLPYGCVENVF